MAALKPDPTYYPSPRMAMQAPPEEHACVAVLNPDGRRDALAAMAVAVALVVYDGLGPMILKHAWFDVDLIRAGALVLAGVIALIV